MKRLLPLSLLLFAALPIRPGQPAAVYRYQYIFQCEASSHILFLIPFRVFYEVSAAVDFAAETGADGRLRFVSLSAPRGACLLRTLGFSGRGALLVVADNDLERGRTFSAGKEAEWRRLFPKYAGRISNLHRVARRIEGLEQGRLRFERTAAGVHEHATADIRTPPVDPSGWHGYYFKVFPILAETLAVYNHPLPAPTAAGFPAESPPLDFTVILNRIGALLEKVVADMVTVKQKAPFRLLYQLARGSGEEWLIVGDAAPRVPVWKSFKIMECRRQARIRRRDGLLLADEFFFNLRNDKGQGGYGKMELIHVR